MAMSKAELRERMRKVREGVADRLALSQQACRFLLAFSGLDAALADPSRRCWFIYVSHRDELQTHDLIRSLLDRGRIVAVPRITPDQAMIAQGIVSFDAMKPGRHGILAPDAEGPELAPDLCIVPCLAVTGSGDRLGMGGGYYDRYLARHPEMATFALAFDEQVIDTIPVEPHDRRMDYIVTPTRVVSCSTGKTL